MTYPGIKTEKVKIHFYKGRHPFSYIIRLRTFSAYSHVAIQIGDIIYEAKEGAGVVMSIAKKKKPESLVKTVTIDVLPETLQKGIDWVKKQEGKKYDYWAILLFSGLPRPYEVDDSWFCSELASVFLYKIGKLKKPKILLSPGAL